MLKIKLMVMLFLFSSSLLAFEMQLESGVKQNILVELFTSEGCSSCPPAESYLNGLKKSAQLWKEIVPVAFHVDYWDYIGWKDEFATKQFGQRQSRYASLKRASTVYTPAFMVNGSNWRRGLFSSSLPESDAAVGKLKVSLNGKSISGSFHAEQKHNFPLKLNVAILGMGLVSKIERGENEGRTAEHEFVVVGFDSKVSTDMNWNMSLPKLHFTEAKEYAIAVWVSEINNPTPLQVVGGLITDYKN